MGQAVKIKLTLLLALLLSLVLPLQAATRYVVDDLNTFFHSGPGTKYRIIGAVKAGEQVNLLSSSATNDYVKIETNNKIGWIDKNLLSRNTGLKEQLSIANNALKQARLGIKSTQEEFQTQQTKIKDQAAAKDKEIENLLMTVSDLKLQLTTAQDKGNELQNTLDTLDQSTKMHWLAYGGGLSFIFLLLGWIIPYLPKKRKQNDRWM